MYSLGMLRRVAIGACNAFALLAAVACQNALARSDHPIRNIELMSRLCAQTSATRRPRGFSRSYPVSLPKP